MAKSQVSMTVNGKKVEELVEPRDDLSFSANFLHMTFGEVPDLAIGVVIEVGMEATPAHPIRAAARAAPSVSSARTVRARARC